MTTLAIGTDKGGWVYQREGTDWQIKEPFFPGWRVTAFGKAADGTYLAGTASGWFGPGLHVSNDLQDWQAIESGPQFEGTDAELEQIWTFTTGPDGRVWCGVAQAGVFVSDDNGHTWQGLSGFNDHPSRPVWQPGAGGMCAHRIVLDGERVTVGASAVGVLRSDDGGQTFDLRTDGLDIAAPNPDHPGVGSCVHALVADPSNPDLLWQQNHQGVYRSQDAGDHWERIEEGLPATFGFPIVRDEASGALFVVPLSADVDRTPVEGRFMAYRSTDEGDSWHPSGTGWPTDPNFDLVLRGAMATDGDGGVVLGTTGGQLWATDDGGDHWERLPGTLPRINAVAVL
ncbi:hypothetical protein BH24ACT15_BH24ACT15_08300 [soil metagenome]